MNYSKLSDEELVELAKREGNGSASMEALLVRYKHAVVSVARSYFLNSGDIDDLIQEGMIGLFAAIHSYKSDKSAFSAYAFLCIKSKILTAIKKGNSAKNSPLINYVSISGIGEDADDKNFMVSDETFDPEEIVINKEREIELFDIIEKILSKLEIQILQWYLKGYSYSEIAAKIGKSEKAIDNGVQRIRRKIAQMAKEC